MISVIIPTYNRAKLLLRSMQSVLEQTFTDLELIVVDDASTDDTEQVVTSVRDDRVRYIRMEKNGGAGAARNAGIAAARGEWIAFQDSDDVWFPDKLARQFAQLKETGADVVFCAFERCTAEGEKLYVFPHAYVQPGKVTYEQLLFENLASTQTILGRKVCFEQVRFKPDFPRLQDWEMMLRMVQQYDVRYFDDVLARMYEQPDSISKNPEKGLAAFEALYAMHKPAIDGSDRLTIRMCHGIAEARRACGMTVWTPYFQRISFRRSLTTNLRLLLTGVKRMLKH